MPVESKFVNKTIMRKRVLRMRKALSLESVELRSYRILNRLIPLIDSAESVMFYIPINREVDVIPLALSVFKHGKNILFPRITNNEIEAVAVKNPEFDFRPGAYGIPEPTGKAWDDTIDLIVVPGVAFDYRKYRIGYGKGYYDRFLTRQDYKKAVGVAYQFQLFNKILHTDNDVRLNGIITEYEKIL